MHLPRSRLSTSEDRRFVRERSLPKQLALRAAQTIFPDRQFVSILKYELSLLTISVYSKLSPLEWAKRISRRNATGLKINLGNGPFQYDGWINIDCRISSKKNVVACDLRRKWPLRNDSARYIFAEHVLEHFGYPDEIGHVLHECYRVLQPGGVLRVIVPNAERYLRAYVDDDENFVREVGGESASSLSVVNIMMRERGFHKYAYDYGELERVIKHVGFSSVMPSSLRASQHEELNLDLNDGQRDLVSLYAEAVK